MIRLQQHLGDRLGCDRLWLGPPFMRGGTVQLRLGTEMVGTVDEILDEGELCWPVTLVVLDEDLTVAAPQT